MLEAGGHGAGLPAPDDHRKGVADVLRRDGKEWRIARRKIVLDQNVLLSKNLTFFF